MFYTLNNNRVMKHKPLLFIILLVCLGATYACKKSAVGFLSPYIHYEVNPVIIPKGRAFLSAGLNGDGTSQPFSVKVLHYYDKTTGKIVDSLFSKTYPVQIFTGVINPLVDTNFALISAKLTTRKITPISVIPASGQIIANFGALNVPGGEYQFDVEITNETGTKVYPKLGDFILRDTTTFDAVPAIGATSETRIMVGNESKSVVGKPPLLTITRVADTPNIITVKYMDKNGALFNPKKGEIISRPAAGLNPNPAFLQSLQQYSRSYYYTDNSCVFRFPLTPFPLTSLGNGYNIYQRIPAKFVHNDGLPDGAYSLNLRFPIRIYVPGSYLVIEQSLDATRVN
jgi:hypothetical protein